MLISSSTYKQVFFLIILGIFTKHRWILLDYIAFANNGKLQMDYREAVQVVKDNTYLVGTAFKGKTISKLLIAPLKEVGIAKLMYNYANDISSGQFYAAYDLFEIWVIFDIDDWLLTGVLDKMPLSKLLPQIATG